MKSPLAKLISMKFETPLIEAKINNRYNRFLSDIELPDGRIVCAHVPNTGAMTTCWGPGWSVLISESDNPKRKLQYTLEMTNNKNTLICVNTGLTNKIVHEALDKGIILELLNYKEIKPEKKVRDSRIDFYLSHNPDAPDAYVEVKNVTLLGENDCALFPDAVSLRGQKHLTDLIELKKQGFRAVMLYVVNREDTEVFMPASHIDPLYANLLLKAYEAGVEILAYESKLNKDEIYLNHKIPVLL